MRADEAATLREARARYFAANGLPLDGGYHVRWVRAPIGPIPFAFPNTAGRQRVLPAHDLHHARWPGRMWRAFARGRRCRNLLATAL